MPPDVRSTPDGARMIFVANVLTMNGGTTFLLRTSRELARRGGRATILLLTRRVDDALYRELEAVATICCVEDFTTLPIRGLLATYAPIDWPRLLAVLPPCTVPVHAMGVFGVWFAQRLCAADPGRLMSVGVYHQNEFIYRVPASRLTDGAQALFAAIPPENVVFFNTATRTHYEHFFARSYASASIVPIGIELPPQSAPEDPPRDPLLISVGNLVDFKTYNAHVIRALPALLASVRGLRYAIIGRGPEDSALRALATSLGVADHVDFVGQVPYADIASHVRRATAFVGSGTALLEAAALGVPALIGIESLATPESYGFLSDIPDLSYNEHVEGRARVSYVNALSPVLTSSAARTRVGQACRRKAEEFSVAATVSGMLDQVSRLRPLVAPRSLPSNVGTALSCVAVAIRDRLAPKSSFAQRRNQSFVITESRP